LQSEWADRAAAAEHAVVGRHIRRVWAMPGTALGVNSWPASGAHRLFLGWNYWWQAHLLDCLTDAEIREPLPDRQRLANRLIRGIRTLNGGRWTNAYYDDMAWLGLALQRADRVTGTDHGGAIDRLVAELLAAWSGIEGGGVPWRRGDVYKNTPANGPAAILLARTGHQDRAAATADWIDDRLRDPATGLIWDGLRPGPGGSTDIDTTIYLYCQGVVLGAELELRQRIPESHPQSAGRLNRLVAAIESRLTSNGVLIGHLGGDSGLFPGIAVRYLARVAVGLPGAAEADEATRRAARGLVLRSAEAAWSNAAVVDGQPVFGHDWTRPAEHPRRNRSSPDRDLSVQLSGWMLLEAAALVTGRNAAIG
jgi:predicted alpha-1,6-mannanase (GH76 family)